MDELEFSHHEATPNAIVNPMLINIRDMAIKKKESGIIKPSIFYNKINL